MALLRLISQVKRSKARAVKLAKKKKRNSARLCARLGAAEVIALLGSKASKALIVIKLVKRTLLLLVKRIERLLRHALVLLK